MRVRTEQVFLLRQESVRTALLAQLQQLPLSPVQEVVIRPHRPERSALQNRYYWAILTELAAQWWQAGRQYAPWVWHEYFKRQLIGLQEVILPDGSVEQHGLSSASLSRSAFADFVQQVVALATEAGVRFSETREEVLYFAQRSRRGRV